MRTIVFLGGIFIKQNLSLVFGLFVFVGFFSLP